MVTVREGILIEVTERGARVVKRNLDDIGESGTRAQGGVSLLNKALGALSIGLITTQFIRLADTFTNLQNRLRLVTDGTDNLRDVTQELFNISNRTRSAFEGTAEVYARLGLATEELGIGQDQLLSFTESLNQAIILSGASATEAQAGLIQLSQGLASGALRGDELRSVLEQLPGVARVIAQGLGVTVGQLRELGAQGAITADVIFDAFQKAEQQLAVDFASTTATVGQAFVVLQNNVLQLVGAVNEFLNTSNFLAQAILLIANNLDILAVALGVAATVLTVRFVQQGLIAAITATRTFFVTLAAGSLGTFVQSITAATVSLVQYVAAGIGPALLRTGLFFGLLANNPIRTFVALMSTLSTAMITYARVAVTTALTATRTFFLSLLRNPIGALTTAVRTLSTAILSYATRALPAAIAATRTFFGLFRSNVFVLAITALTTIVGLLFRFREQLGFLTPLLNAIADAAGRVFSFIREQLEALGILSFNDGVSVELKGDDAADKIKAAFDQGGTEAGNKVKEGLQQGSQQVAQGLQQGGQQLTEQFNNGVESEAAPVLANALGGAAQQGAQALGGGVQQGAQQGGHIFEAAGIGFGKEAAAILTRAGIDVARVMERAIIRQLQLVRAQTDLLKAQAFEAREEGRARARESKAALREASKSFSRTAVADIGGGSSTGIPGDTTGTINIEAQTVNVNGAVGGATTTTTETVVTEAAADSFGAAAGVNPFFDPITGPRSLSPANGGLTFPRPRTTSIDDRGINLGRANLNRGGSFEVSGRPGIDTNTLDINGQPVANVSSGERIDVVPRRQAGFSGGVNQVTENNQRINVVIQTPDAESFKRTEGQVQAQLQRELMRSSQRNN